MLRSGEALPSGLPAHPEGLTDLTPGAARAASRIRSRALDRVEVALELRGCSEHFEGISILTVDQSIPCLPRGEFLTHVCQGALTTLYVSRIPDTNAGLSDANDVAGRHVRLPAARAGLPCAPVWVPETHNSPTDSRAAVMPGQEGGEALPVPGRVAGDASIRGWGPREGSLELALPLPQQRIASAVRTSPSGPEPNAGLRPLRPRGAGGSSVAPNAGSGRASVVVRCGLKSVRRPLLCAPSSRLSQRQSRRSGWFLVVALGVQPGGEFVREDGRHVVPVASDAPKRESVL
jgi:hypothetical protein